MPLNKYINCANINLVMNVLFKKIKKTFGSSNFDMMIVGLGNPGIEYEGSRHNVGFAVIDALCEKHNAKCERMKFKSYIGEANIGGERVLLQKPLTYMNNSGEAVAACSKFYKIPVENILVIYDDISLEPGTIRIRRKGSAGGHNGLKDIIAYKGEDFPRIKIGIGAKPHPDYELKDWVLGKFSGEDKEKALIAVGNAVRAVGELLSRGIDSAMNKYSK